MVDLGSITLGIFLSLGIYTTGFSVLFEILLPILHLYHILTFSLAYPESSQLRRFLVSFLLSFSEIIFSIFLLSQDFPRRSWFWLFEFILVYTMVATLSHKEIQNFLSRKKLRTFIYAATGHLKAIFLTTGLTYLNNYFQANSIQGFLVHLVTGMFRQMITVLVYLADRFWTAEALDRETLEGVHRRLKVSLVLTCVLLELNGLEPINEPLYEPFTNCLSLAANTFMIVLYLNEANVYGLRLKQD